MTNKLHHYYALFAAIAELTMVTTFHILHLLHIRPAIPIGVATFLVYAVVTIIYLHRTVLDYHPQPAA